jgi:hypothetical protein
MIVPKWDSDGRRTNPDNHFPGKHQPSQNGTCLGLEHALPARLSPHIAAGVPKWDARPAVARKSGKQEPFADKGLEASPYLARVLLDDLHENQNPFLLPAR